MAGIGTALRAEYIKGLRAHRMSPREVIAISCAVYPGLSPMLAEFLAHYEANIAAESRPYPGVVAALDTLAAEGATLALCTKREHLSRKLLQELDLTRYFSGLAGRDTFPVSKPDPAHLIGTIQLAGGPSSAVMVGDSEVDFMTAKAALVPIVMVRFGYGPPP